MRMRMFKYNSERDRQGRPAWFDCQSRRWIARRTASERSGIPYNAVVSYENSRDGYGFTWFSRKEIERFEQSCKVILA